MTMMKKQYITPATTVISLRAGTILNASRENLYGNNEGKIMLNLTEEVDAGEAD